MPHHHHHHHRHHHHRQHLVLIRDMKTVRQIVVIRREKSLCVLTSARLVITVEQVHKYHRPANTQCLLFSQVNQIIVHHWELRLTSRGEQSYCGVQGAAP